MENTMNGSVVRWQIVAKDPEAVTKFYSSVFGWTVNRDNSLGYREVKSANGKGIDGGIWPSPPEGHNLVQLFIEVDDVDATIEKASARGATVIVPRSALPDGDVMAILADPAGLSFGLVQKRA
jgi:predicted enzyme related to lactoylglutathione lyase